MTSKQPPAHDTSAPQRPTLPQPAAWPGERADDLPPYLAPPPPASSGPIVPREFEDSFAPECVAAKDRIVAALKTCYDPEIPVDIYELGLIYEIRVSDARHAYVAMTLTSPACPVAGTLPGEVERKVKAVEGVADAVVNLVWDPPWGPAKMSEAAKLALNMF